MKKAFLSLRMLEIERFLLTTYKIKLI